MSEWISVKDRLPEKDGRYLAITKHYKQPVIAQYTKNEKYPWNWLMNNVTHWMPLPEPPKEAE